MEVKKSNGFYEMTEDEMVEIDAGGWKSALCIFGGTVGLAWSIPIGCLNPGAGLMLAGASLAALDVVI